MVEVVNCTESNIDLGNGWLLMPGKTVHVPEAAGVFGVSNGIVVIGTNGPVTYPTEPPLAVFEVGIAAGVMFGCAAAAYLMVKRAFVKADGWFTE